MSTFCVVHLPAPSDPRNPKISPSPTENPRSFTAGSFAPGYAKTRTVHFDHGTALGGRHTATESVLRQKMLNRLEDRQSLFPVEATVASTGNRV